MLNIYNRARIQFNLTIPVTILPEAWSAYIIQSLLLPFVWTQFSPHIDQKITELGAEQQKNNAKRALDKFQFEKLKQGIGNAWKQKESIFKALEEKAETRIAELDTNLSTNLERQKQELESVKFSCEIGILLAEAEAEAEAETKREELRYARLLDEDVTQQLKRVSESIGKCARRFGKIEEEKNNFKNLEENYQRTRQDETKELQKRQAELDAGVEVLRRN
ncbi:hypothetical protein U1Q18_017565 [Sarracenia purpurea var. burkii]